MAKTRILLAEDDPNHQVLLSSVLTEDRPEVEVHVVGSGREALAALREADDDSYDCMVLDFNLPDCDAGELLHKMDRQGRRLPILVISSCDEQRVVIESIRNGCVDFVPKVEAVSGDHLWRRVSIAMTEFQRRREAQRKLVRRSQQLAKLADQDPLTGLANRRRVQRLFEGARRVFDRRDRVSVYMLDVDWFKRINDTFGHEAGDRVLGVIARCLLEGSRPGDMVCRWGGEEFVVIRADKDVEAAFQWAEQTREQIGRNVVMSRGVEIRVTVSIGVFNCAGAELNRRTISQAIERADQAMYLAKQGGRDRVCLWEAPSDREAGERRRRAAEEFEILGASP